MSERARIVAGTTTNIGRYIKQIDAFSEAMANGTWHDTPQTRGEQPDGQAMPADRAMIGDTPRSYTSESEVK